MNNAIFREYDIRGNVERDLTDDVVKDIARAFGAYMVERGKKNASISRDCRLSSDHLRDVVIEGMVESGLDVIDIGVKPTPLFYYSLFNLDVDGGIMITGSHNPGDQNGFKVAFGKATLFGEEIQYIRKVIEEKRFVSGKGSVKEYTTIVADYYDFLRNNIKLNKKLKVVLDAGNGTGGVVALPIMKEMGQDVTGLYCDMDGRFPNHHPDPTVEKNIAVLKQTVLETQADIGVGYDGDADRIGVIDNEGNIIWGDYLMVIFARDILKTRKGATIVSEVKCSKNLYEEIEKNGGKPIMWKAGHSLIKQKMKETGALLGGEMSGHIFFADKFFGYDDAIYASLRLLEIMGNNNKPLSEYLKDLPKLYSTPEIRIDCPDNVKFQVVKRLTEYYKSKYKVIDIDGVRAVFNDGWGLVRPSNTGPILVLRFEAESEDALERIQKMVTKDLTDIMKEHV
ncbi:MAG: Phosphomannomutase/phosphoglucomutase [Syntrophorhabdaceae bacterium]|nr:Phosphomannomutase/phosphoglucomutase [Syntrophorhabdaceae bacterium]MDI9559655.1 phosphomannomutase/phosphoglucomutase [Pseudomonadota bacterium]HNQ63769.1 phosphomannomutase/phosphoglucomutase [Syntrophorhabdaceae bacterium]HNZ58448.1 phosphomannomutase/phosphoglucomutase [Syntrophorhabdaceae bacterium]